MLIFTLTIFLGALLLFQVELIIGKTILPWFGGTSAVWITCMLFFQIALLAGYAYGHALDHARTRAQTRLHQLLLGATVVVLGAQFFLWHSPLILDASWKPRAGGNPLLQILTLLAVSVGLPYLVLASTAPLLQSWWRRLYPQRSPYRLYAVSNLGSFLGLVSYPFLVEPFLTLKTQALMWSAGYAAFAAGCAYCAARASSSPHRGAEDLNVAPGFSPAAFARVPASAVGTAAPPDSAAAAPFGLKGAGFGPRPQAAEECRAEDRGATLKPSEPSAGGIVLWLSLAAVASALLLATTNQLCKNVAAVPLLWVLPLAIYLLTFTLCFESDRRYSRKWFHPAFALGTFLICFVLATGAGKNLAAQIAIYSFGLFAACMVCHGELARLKPDPRHLTLFYLVVAAGGVLGGLFVGLAAPYLFVGYWEYEVSLWLAALLYLVVLYRDRGSWFYNARVPAPLVLIGAAALLPESMALAVGSTQLAGSIPSVVVIVGALFFLQGQTKRRKTKSAGMKLGAAQPELALRLGNLEPASAPDQTENRTRESEGLSTQPNRTAASGGSADNVAPGFSPASFAADVPERPKTRTLKDEGLSTQPNRTAASGGSADNVAPGFSPASFAADASEGPKTRTLKDEGLSTQPNRTAASGGSADNVAPGFSPASFAADTPGSAADPRSLRRGQLSLLAGCAIVLLVLGATLTTVAKATLGPIASVRNFYGALTIDHQFPFERDREAYALKHGEIFHGFEFRAPQRHLLPTSYFSEDSGLGLLLAPHLHAADPADAAAAAAASGTANTTPKGKAAVAASPLPISPDEPGTAGSPRAEALVSPGVPHPSFLRVRVFGSSDTSAAKDAGLKPGATQPTSAPRAPSRDPRAAGSTAAATGATAPAAAPLRIGDVGLGIGTVAAYARPGDSVRFYEINPQVVMLASDPRYFQFLHDSAAPIDVVLGDGRLSLERELAQGVQNDYDVLIVDAFNGDAVPVHLLTIEAFELYLKRLKNPGGVLAMNVTNTFLDLRPVVIAAAERLGLASLWVHCDGDGLVSYTNDWVLVSRDRQRLDAVAAAANDAARHPNSHAATLAAPPSRLWTDDYSNLFQALR